MIISGTIDVTKIDKSRLYKGEKGTYLNVVIFVNDKEDKYGNQGPIIESIAKEERLQGKQGVILGNIKVLSGSASQQSSSDNNVDIQTSDDIPFWIKWIELYCF